MVGQSRGEQREPSGPRNGWLASALAGGVMLLLPLLLILFLVRQGISLVEPAAERLAPVIPIVDRLGPLGELAVAILLLLVATCLLGLLAVTAPGHLVAQRLWNSPIAALPLFSFVRGYLAMLSPAAGEVKVVLVPSDQGRTLAFVFGDIRADPVCVFVPSAPNWRSGSISFAARADVEETGIGFVAATMMLMRMGASFESAQLGMGAQPPPPRDRG
jgi:uncharacterized membrane protein